MKYKTEWFGEKVQAGGKRARREERGVPGANLNLDLFPPLICTSNKLS